MENTDMKLITDIHESNTIVGISINVNHLKALPIGATVHCKAILKKLQDENIILKF